MEGIRRFLVNMSRESAKISLFFAENEKINFGYCILKQSGVSYRKRSVGSVLTMFLHIGILGRGGSTSNRLTLEPFFCRFDVESLGYIKERENENE